jgi:uncharacterized RDD family membrane protein YckC
MSEQHPNPGAAPGPYGQQPPVPTGQPPVYGAQQPAYGHAPPPPPYGQAQDFAHPSYSPQPAYDQTAYTQPGLDQTAYAQPGYGLPLAGSAQGGYPAPTYANPGGYQPPAVQPPAVQPWPPAAIARPRTDYASWGRRVLAMLIDQAPSLVGSIVLMVAYWMTIVIITQQGTNGSTPPNFRPVLLPAIIGGGLALAGLGWEIYNRWIVAGKTGQSLGKRIMKISLVSEQTGQPIGPLNAFCRDLVHILDGAAYVGYLWPLWDDKRQTFADMLMKTVVLDARRGTPSSIQP